MRAEDRPAPDRSARQPAGSRQPAATRQGPQAPGSAAAILALQRTAGNGAVVQLLAQARHTHDAGCGHQAPVQRSAVPEVLRSAGTPLAGPVREEMEARLGADFSDVRLHTGVAAQRSAAEIGARAFTSGSHVVIGDGGSDRHTLAHELTHVVQQRSGPVSGTDNGSGLSVSDPSDSFERAAEANATRALAGPVPTGRPPASASAPAAASRGPSVSAPVQRQLTVANVDLSATARTDRNVVHRVFAEVCNAPLDAETLARVNANNQAILKQLDKWILDDAGNLNTTPKANPSQPHAVFGTKRQDRTYNNYAELARALLGWVEAKPERHRERLAAEAVQDNPQISIYLDSLLTKVRLKLNVMTESGQLGRSDPDLPAKIAEELRTGISSVTGGHLGHYQKYFSDLEKTNSRMARSAINYNVLELLKNPQAYSFRDKIIALHDLMEYFGGQRAWIDDRAGMNQLPEPGQGTNRSTTSVDFRGARAGSTEDRGQAPRLPSTRDENEASTKFARKNKIPVWAGASMTTVRMENLAQWAGGSVREKEALGWGIFSFWRLDYDHTFKLAYHTLHEVMDMVHNFGVDYAPLDRERGLGTFTLENMVKDVTDTWVNIRARVATYRTERDTYRDTMQANPNYAGNMAVLNTSIELVENALRATEAEWQQAVRESPERQRQALRSNIPELNAALSAMERMAQLTP